MYHRPRENKDRDQTYKWSLRQHISYFPVTENQFPTTTVDQEPIWMVARERVCPVDEYIHSFEERIEFLIQIPEYR
jgi:hypothetical protein